MKNSHKLKTDPKVFQDVLDGNKTFEIRFNDRDFQAGDELILKETLHSGEEIKEGSPLEYTGREISTEVTYVLSGYGLQEGWVILGIVSEAGQQSQQAKIDELQARVDGAMKYVSESPLKDVSRRAMINFMDILKGNKD